jgi:acetyl esterase/lipase
VLFWVFGGAYVGGDPEGNAGLAERFARQLGCDVFLPDMRLYPEAKIKDAYTDVCRAYEWLMSRKKPEQVVVLGISSGGGVALRVLQLANASAEERRGFFVNGDAAPPQPAGAALLGPFVDYTFEDGSGTNSVLDNQHIDWLVQTRLVEWMMPRAADMCGGEACRTSMSPLFQPMTGLCPVCISVSEHEACLDQCLDLNQKLKSAGNDVHLYTRPFLCHAYQMFPAFLPEAQAAEAELCAWMQQRFR